MAPVLWIIFFIAPQVLSLTIDPKLDLPFPVILTSSDGQSIRIDSSLSPKIVKAFYEINFAPVTSSYPSKSHIVITDSKGCPYSKDLCKYYFAPSKVSVVQKVEDLIAESKKETEVPVVQGIAVSADQKLLKDLSPKIKTHLRQNEVIRNRGNSNVPVYRGTVNVQGVLNRPEISTLPDYWPQYPEIHTQCFLGACWYYLLS